MAETDHGLALRGGVIGRLLAGSAVPPRCADRVYGRDVPKGTDWPFCRVEIDEALPDEASCWIGEDRTFRINGFTRPTDALPDAEAEAFKLLKAILKDMGGAPLVLELEPGEVGPIPEVLELFLRSSSVRIDVDEPGAYHARVEFSAKTVEEA